MNKLFGTFIIVSLALLSCNNQTSSDNSSITDTVGQLTVINNFLDSTKTETKEDLVSNSADNSLSQPIPTEERSNESLIDILKKLDNAPQTFSIASNQDTTILCSEGTSIKFKSNSFVSETTGKEITGRVKLSVQEYYKLADMLFAKLTTTSGKDILETGGMIYITAASGNENCILKKGNTVELGFPYKEKKENMKLFNGNWINSKVNWTLNQPTSNNSSSNSSQTFVMIEDMPTFSGGEPELKNYMQKNLQYPFSALDKKVEGRVVVKFVVDEFGDITNVGILKGIEPSLDKAAFYIVSNMPAWKPGEQQGNPVATQYILPIKFTLKGTQVTPAIIEKSKKFEEQIANVKVVYGSPKMTANNESLKKKFEDRVNDTTLASTQLGVVSRYLFSSSQLGWINCDRFYLNNTPRIDYVVDVGESSDNYVSLVFHSMKAMLDGYQASSKYKFNNVPTGEKVTIVAMKKVNDKTFLAIKESTTASKGETDLTFEPVSMAKLKLEIQKLNSLN